MTQAVPTVQRLLLLVALTAVLSPAQSAMQCTASATPRPVRSDGLAELVADVVLTCSGGTQTPSGASIPQGNFSLTIAQNPWTSRPLSGTWSEALLLIDEPVPANQLACATANGVCAMTV